MRLTRVRSCRDAYYSPTPAILPEVTHRDDNGQVVHYVPAQPCPEVLTEEEAARYLRLDLLDVRDPADTLRYYRKKGLLRATQIGKAVRYRPSSSNDSSIARPMATPDKDHCMATQTSVVLASNGEYWLAWYCDQYGNRRAKSLGPMRDMSKRAAQERCELMAAEFMLNAGRASADKAPRLGEYIESYLGSRTDLRPGSQYLQQLTARYHREFFKADPRIDMISRYDARNWRAALARGDGRNQPMADPTVCHHVRNAKTIFNRAVEDDLIPFNPFDKLKGSAPEPDKDWHYVSRADLRLLWNACRNIN